MNCVQNSVVANTDPVARAVTQAICAGWSRVVGE